MAEYTEIVSLPVIYTQDLLRLTLCQRVWPMDKERAVKLNAI